MASHNTDADARLLRPTSDDEETSRRSRARVSRACTRCRARKDKCDGKQPECSSCTAAGQPCQYTVATKKRGLPEGYVRGLEKLWAVMLQKVEGLDNAVRRVVDEHEDELALLWNHHKHGEELHATWKESSILADLERLLSRIDHAPPDLKRKRDREDSETGAIVDDNPGANSLTPGFRVTEIQAGDSTVRPTQLGSREQWLGDSSFAPGGRTAVIDPTLVPEPGSSMTSAHKAVEVFPLPSDASHLLAHYFTYTHCWLPILDRPYTLKRFYEHSRSKSGRLLESGDFACLWAIFAYTHRQTRHTSRPLSQERSNSVPMMRATARSFIPTDTGPFRIGHVQALLILALLDVGLGDWTSAWMMVGHAVRALLDAITSENTTGQNRANWAFAAVPRRQQSWQAVLQGCFILDTAIALQMGRPPHLQTNHLTMDGMRLADEDGHEEWEPWNVGERNSNSSPEPAFAISTFNRLTELFMIANDTVTFARYRGALPDNHDISRWCALAERYPFMVSEVVHRAPHHMLLQACHFAIGANIPEMSLNIQQSATAHFCNILESFEEAFNLPDMCGIPSFLIMVGNLPNVSRSKDQSWSHDIANFKERYQQCRSKLGPIWPGFALPEDPGAHALPSAPGLSSHVPDSQRIVFPISPPSTSNLSTSNHLALESFAHPNGISVPFAPEAEKTNDTVPVGPPLLKGADYQPMSIDHMGHDMHPDFTVEHPARRATFTGAGTTPSFNGDEIDALFHEMAQLDTTQWTMDRTQALKEFGFSDDSTFEAFCNDPDRLMLSDGFMGPVFNNSGGVASGSQASMMNQLGDSQLGRMTFEDIFR
jgi:hypothetical protein